MITKYANVFEMDKTFVPVIALMAMGGDGGGADLGPQTARAADRAVEPCQRLRRLSKTRSRRFRRLLGGVSSSGDD
jgi:hypothetical protein